MQAAAMFKVLRNKSPPIPETLSAEGKNFLQYCFKRNPADRPSATKFLEHPFVKNSHHQEMNGCIEAISRMKLMVSLKFYRPILTIYKHLNGSLYNIIHVSVTGYHSLQVSGVVWCKSPHRTSKENSHQMGQYVFFFFPLMNFNILWCEVPVNS